MNWERTRHVAATLAKELLAKPHAKVAEEAWRLRRDECEMLQGDQFARIMTHAQHAVPFYKKRVKQYPQITGSQNWREYLKALPILTKQAVREANAEFRSNAWAIGVTCGRTSGNTGTPLKIWASARERGFSHAIWDGWLRRLLHTRRSPRMIILTGFLTLSPTSSALYWSALGGRRIHLNMYALTDNNRERLCKLLRAQPKAILFGYPSALAQLARVVGDALGQEKERFVAVTTSEVLSPNARASIEGSLCSRVYNQYGSVEACHLGLECDAGNLHMHPLVGIVELLNDEDRPCENGELGRVVVTGLQRRTTPLVRYDLGDSAIAMEETCPCGLAWPMIGTVIGRTDDLVLTPDKRTVGMLSYDVLRNLAGIVEAQLVQQSYERFEFRIVMDRPVTQNDALVTFNESQIVAEMKARLGYEVHVAFVYLPAIPRDSGRHKFKSVVVNFDVSAC
jgi:phenylacetate-CoA ligase